MKTENNIENKAKFFALYWGQEVLSLNHNSPCHVKGHNIDKIFITDVVSYVALKPLSAISDEDAIEVANIVLESLYRKNWKVTRDFIVTGFPYIRVHHKNSPYYFQIDATLVNFDVGKMGENVTSETDMKPTHCLDFLRSKGYLIGCMDLTQEDLIEYGWAKLQDNEST